MKRYSGGDTALRKDDSLLRRFLWRKNKFEGFCWGEQRQDVLPYYSLPGGGEHVVYVALCLLGEIPLSIKQVEIAGNGVFAAGGVRFLVVGGGDCYRFDEVSGQREHIIGEVDAVISNGIGCCCHFMEDQFFIPFKNVCPGWLVIQNPVIQREIFGIV